MFQEGVRLFNQSQFFACHEVWESLWLRTSSPEREALQGWIQIAVAYHHLEIGNINGAQYLLSRTKPRIVNTEPPFPSSTVKAVCTALLEDIRRCRAGIRITHFPRLT